MIGRCVCVCEPRVEHGVALGMWREGARHESVDCKVEC